MTAGPGRGLASAELFWTAVDMTGDCWEWTRARRPEGYGTVSLNGRPGLASRRAYELAVGPIPKGMLVCHTCDNPPCCRPAHLFLGGKRENALDASRKGRGTGRLNAAQVRDIRRRLLHGERQIDVARALGIGWWLVQDVVRRRSYLWVVEEGGTE